MRRLALFISHAVFTLALASCGKPMNKYPFARTLSPEPGYKPTAQCTAAKNSVKQILYGTENFAGAGYATLADGSCGVTVQLSAHNNIVPLLRTLKAASKFYSYIWSGNTLVSLWYDEAPATFPPVRDHGGKSLNPAPLDDECSQAAKLLVATFPSATFTAVRNPRPGMKQCYVDGVFHDDTTFESFFTWDNPNSQNHEPFHMNFKRANGVHTTVWVHALREIPQN